MGKFIISDRDDPSHRFFSNHSLSWDISEYCRKNDLHVWQYVEHREGPKIWDYLSEIWQVMQNSIKEGLDAQGVLQGDIALRRKVRYLYRQRHVDESEETRTNRLICAYAYAVAST